MRPTQKLALSAGLALSLVACNTQIAVEADIENFDQNLLVEAFFGEASAANIPTFESEDFDGDGNLDVNEDANANGILDGGEDLDGDARLDVVNEDRDGNGVLNDFQVDLNDDGLIDENDVTTFSNFFLVLSEGQLSCEEVAEKVAVDRGLVLIEGSLLTVAGGHQKQGQNAPGAFQVDGNLDQIASPEEILSIGVSLTRFQDGEGLVVLSNLGDELAPAPTIFDKSRERSLNLELETTLFDLDGQSFPLSLDLRRAERCEALDVVLAEISEGGEVIF